MKLVKAFIGSMLVALPATSTAVYSASLTCASISSTPLPADTAITVQLEPGEAIYVTPENGMTRIQFEGNGIPVADNCGPGLSQSCTGASFAATVSGLYTIEEFSDANSATLTCAAASGATTTSSGVTTAQSAGAKAAGASSTGAVNTAINSALTGGPGITATQNGVFFSTQGQNSTTHLWGAIQGRRFDGGVSGHNLEFTLGGDITVADTTRLGLFVSKGRADLSVGGVAVTADALSVGPYFRAGIGQNYDITGFALFAKPDYNTGGTTYTATRRAFGLQANATYALSGTEINSWLGVRGFSEDHPAAGALAAKAIRDVTASIGTKAVFGQDALRPYLSVAAEYHNNQDGAVKDTFFSPRLGMGFTYTAGRGQLNLDLDGGKVLSNTRDYGLNIGYSLDF